MSAVRDHQSLTIEITTRCNLKCVMCPHGLPGGYPGQRDADDALLDGVIGSLDRLDLIRPTGVGEPLLSNGFWRLVDALKDRTSPSLVFVTNGILLTPANVGRLLAAPIQRVTVSVDAVRPETHARIRGNDLERTVAGIKTLKSVFASAGKKIDLVMSFVMMRENHREIPDFVDFAADLGAIAVYFEHLGPLMSDARDWNVDRGGWRFNYAEQDMRNDPEVADAMMSDAVCRADARGLALGGFHVFVDPQNEKAHLDRPSRRGFLAGVHRAPDTGAPI